MTNTFMHSLENRTRIQTKIGNVYTRFQTKTVQKPYPFRAAHTHTYKANVREYPPPPTPRDKDPAECFEHGQNGMASSYK